MSLETLHSASPHSTIVTHFGPGLWISLQCARVLRALPHGSQYPSALRGGSDMDPPGIVSMGR